MSVGRRASGLLVAKFVYVGFFIPTADVAKRQNHIHCIFCLYCGICSPMYPIRKSGLQLPDTKKAHGLANLQHENGKLWATVALRGLRHTASQVNCLLTSAECFPSTHFKDYFWLCFAIGGGGKKCQRLKHRAS